MTVLNDPPRICEECGGEELGHVYSGPSHNSDDGLPTFEGCAHLGVTIDGEDEDGFEYGHYNCNCTGWDHEDDY